MPGQRAFVPTRLGVHMLVIFSLLATLIVATPRAARAATATFSNPTAITTVYGGNANPYPSTIPVSGMSGTISTVTITLHGMNHEAAQAFDVLLVGPDGAHLVVMGYAGVFEIDNATFTFDDAATAALPSNNYLRSGTYVPTAYAPNVFKVPAPAHPLTYAAPAGSGTFTSVYRGLNPNGTWSLYVQDSYGWDDGYVSGGWSMTITTVTDSTAPAITPNVSGTLGSDGWYTDDVSVNWNVVEAESRVASSSGCDATSMTTDTAGSTLTCTATSPGGTSTQSVTIKRDATAPTLAPTVDPNPVEVNQPATATANASDSLSGIASQGCDTPNTAAVDQLTVTCTATDRAGNTATAQASYSVVDLTAPVITSNVSGTLGEGGWYTSDVVVTWTITEPESDITSSGCDPTTISTDTTGQTLSCSVQSAGGTSILPTTIKRDATAPTIAPTVSPNPVVVNQPATATANATDATSGVASEGCDTPITSTVGEQTVTCTATDNAGNVTTANASYTVTDPTAPVITPTVGGTLGLIGWYTSDVTVSWTVTDAESEITATNGCGTITITNDTSGTTLPCSATSAGGPASASITIKRDATAPIVTYSGNQGTYALLDTIAIGCSATDALSGIASNTCVDVSGLAMTFGQGQYQFSAVATDNAGNVGTGTTSFVVGVTYADLTTLTQRYVNQATVERSALSMLEIARQAALRGQTSIEQLALANYRMQIQSAISRRYISAADGAQLIELSRSQ